MMRCIDPTGNVSDVICRILVFVFTEVFHISQTHVIPIFNAVVAMKEIGFIEMIVIALLDRNFSSNLSIIEAKLIVDYFSMSNAV